MTKYEMINKIVCGAIKSASFGGHTDIIYVASGVPKKPVMKRSQPDLKRNTVGLCTEGWIVWEK